MAVPVSLACIGCCAGGCRLVAIISRFFLMTVLTVWYYFPVPLATFAFLLREFWDSMCF